MSHFYHFAQNGLPSGRARYSNGGGYTSLSEARAFLYAFPLLAMVRNGDQSLMLTVSNWPDKHLIAQLIWLLYYVWYLQCAFT